MMSSGDSDPSRSELAGDLPAERQGVLAVDAAEVGVAPVELSPAEAQALQAEIAAKNLPPWFKLTAISDRYLVRFSELGDDEFVPCHTSDGNTYSATRMRRFPGLYRLVRLDRSPLEEAHAIVAEIPRCCGYRGLVRLDENNQYGDHLGGRPLSRRDAAADLAGTAIVRIGVFNLRAEGAIKENAD